MSSLYSLEIAAELLSPATASLEQGGAEMSQAELTHRGAWGAGIPAEVCTLGHFPYSLPKLKRSQANSHCPKALFFKLKFT